MNIRGSDSLFIYLIKKFFLFKLPTVFVEHIHTIINIINDTPK
jgi:hypothetical protein